MIIEGLELLTRDLNRVETEIKIAAEISLQELKQIWVRQAAEITQSGNYRRLIELQRVNAKEFVLTSGVPYEGVVELGRKDGAHYTAKRTALHSLIEWDAREILKENITEGLNEILRR